MGAIQKACNLISKYYLYVINFVILIMGIVIMAVGDYAMARFSVIGNLIGISRAGIGAVIAVGVFYFLIALIGIIAVYKQMRQLQILYNGVTVIIILFAFIAGIATLVYAAKIPAIKDHVTDPTVALSPDLVMMDQEFRCMWQECCVYGPINNPAPSYPAGMPQPVQLPCPLGLSAVPIGTCAVLDALDTKIIASHCSPAIGTNNNTNSAAANVFVNGMADAITAFAAPAGGFCLASAFVTIVCLLAMCYQMRLQRGLVEEQRRGRATDGDV